MTSITRSRIRKVGLMAFMAPCGSRDTVAPRYGRWRLFESFASVVSRSSGRRSASNRPRRTAAGWRSSPTRLPSVVLHNRTRRRDRRSGPPALRCHVVDRRTSCPVSAAYTAVTLLARMRISLTKGPRPSRSVRPACGPSHTTRGGSSKVLSSCATEPWVEHLVERGLEVQQLKLMRVRMIVGGRNAHSTVETDWKASAQWSSMPSESTRKDPGPASTASTRRGWRWRAEEPMP